MEAKLLNNQNGLRTSAIVFQKDEELRQGLLEFARTNRFADAHLSAIGAFSEVTLGFFDRKEKKYIKIPISEQVEVLSFTGNIVQNDGDQPCMQTVGHGCREGWQIERRYWISDEADVFAMRDSSLGNSLPRRVPHTARKHWTQRRLEMILGTEIKKTT